MHVTRGAHTFRVFGHFWVERIVVHLQRFVSLMKVIVTMHVKGCVLCICNSTNRKLGLYTPLPIPSHPWESISMDYARGFPMSKRGHDYLYVVVDRILKMCVLMPCKK